MLDGVDEREGGEHNLPRREAGQEPIEAAKEEESGAFWVPLDEAGGPEEENEEDLGALPGRAWLAVELVEHSRYSRE